MSTHGSKKTNDPLKLARCQVGRYWRFLLAAGLKDDIQQEVQIAMLEADPLVVGVKPFNLALNRRLYALARSAGFRKRHRDEKRSAPLLQWWHRPIISIEEVDAWKL